MRDRCRWTGGLFSRGLGKRCGGCGGEGCVTKTWLARDFRGLDESLRECKATSK